VTDPFASYQGHFNRVAEYKVGDLIGHAGRTGIMCPARLPGVKLGIYDVSAWGTLLAAGMDDCGVKQ
jgi:hypothetical protein